MASAYLQARDLSRRFPGGGISGLDLDVAPGTVLGVAGPNGAGKSTALGLFATRIQADRGSLHIAGIDAIARCNAARRHIGYLAHQPPLYDDMRVADFLAHAARINGIARSDIGPAIEQAMQGTGTHDVAQRRIRHLSAGYRRRTGLAQALVHDPAVLILDEPTTGLDAQATGDFVARLEELTAQRAVIVASHLFTELDRLCHRVAIVQGGELAANEPLTPQPQSGNNIVVRLRDASGRTPSADALGLSSAEPTGDGALRVRDADDATRRRLLATVLERGWSLDEWSHEGNRTERLYRSVVESLPC